MEDTIQIGAQIWMTQNLNVAHFRNGDPIEEAKTAEDWKAAGENKKPAWCYYNNDPTNGEKYGKLYNWYAVNDSRGLAPNGWKLPEIKCFSQLLVFLNATEGISHNILKSTLGWEDYEYYAQTDTYEVFFESTGEVLSGNGNNESGFNGLPGGGRSKNGDFYYRGNNAFYWTFDQLKEPTLSNYELDEIKYGDQLGLISLENYGAIHPSKESLIIKELGARALIFGLHSYAEYDPSRNVGFYESIFSIGNKQSGYSVRCIKNDNISNNTFLSAATINGEILKFASDEIKKNKELVIAAVKQNGLMLEFAHNDLKDDKEVVLFAVLSQGIALQFASDNLKNDRITVLIAVQSRGNALRYASDDLKNDKLVVQNAVQDYGAALKYASDDLKNNKDVVMIAVKGRKSWGAGILQYSSERLRNDKDVVLNAVEKNGICLQFASDNLKNDREIVLIAVQNDGAALQYASDNLKNDREIVLIAVQNDGAALQYASDNLKNDREIVLIAVQTRYGRPLKYASDNLKNDREIVLIAVQKYGEEIEYASDNLKNDHEIILCSVRSVLEIYPNEDDDWSRNDWSRNEYFTKLNSYCLKSVLKVVLLEICQEFCYDRPLPLPFDLGDELSNDRSFILDAVKINGLTLHNASDILKSDPEVCLEAIKNEKNSFEFIDESLKSNKEFLYQISLL